jgi:hypothetical protein
MGQGLPGGIGSGVTMDALQRFLLSVSEMSKHDDDDLEETTEQAAEVQRKRRKARTVRPSRRLMLTGKWSA